MDATFEEVVKLAEQLTPQLQDLLIFRLRMKQSAADSVPVTRELLLEELKLIRQSADPTAMQSLYGKYANESGSPAKDEDFHAALNSIAKEWEQELDEFHSKRD